MGQNDNNTSHHQQIRWPWKLWELIEQEAARRTAREGEIVGPCQVIKDIVQQSLEGRRK